MSALNGQLHNRARGESGGGHRVGRGFSLTAVQTIPSGSPSVNGAGSGGVKKWDREGQRGYSMGEDVIRVGSSSDGAALMSDASSSGSLSSNATAIAGQ